MHKGGELTSKAYTLFLDEYLALCLDDLPLLCQHHPILMHDDAQSLAPEGTTSFHASLAIKKKTLSNNLAFPRIKPD